MDAVSDFLVSYGYVGVLVASFLAASILPFSSEAVMVALLAAGLDPVWLIVYGTVGNVLGGMLNYGIGSLGKLSWIEKYLHVKKKDLDRAGRFMGGKGAWAGFFAFLPVVGDAITVLLGLLRANIPITVLSMTIGKLLRYIVLIYGASLFI